MVRSLKSYTSRQLVVASWKSRLEDAYSLMHARGVRHIPVVDDDDNLVGIISDRDFQRAMQVEGSDLFAAPGEKVEFGPATIVRDFMSWPVETIEETQSVAEAARHMIDRKISALIVTRDEEAVGIVTTEDLLRALLDAVEGPGDKLKQNVEELVYRSPIGDIAQRIADIGI